MDKSIYGWIGGCVTSTISLVIAKRYTKLNTITVYVLFEHKYDLWMIVVIVLIQSFHYTIVSTTSDHHDLQQLHDLVKDKDSFLAQLNRRVVTILKEKEDALQQLKVSSQKQLSLRSSQKTTGTS